MKVSYKKLWILLINKDLKKTDLKELIGISGNTLAKLSRDEFISMETMARICVALGVGIGDIMDIFPDEKNAEGK